MKNIGIISVPGLFNTGKRFFEKPNKFYENLGCKCFSVDLPSRDIPFSSPAPKELGSRTWEQDIAFLHLKILNIQSSYPELNLVGDGHSRGALLLLEVAQKEDVNINFLRLFAPAMPAGLGEKGLNFTRIITFFPTFLNPNWKNKPVKRTKFGFRYGALDPKMTSGEVEREYEKLVWEAGPALHRLGYNPPEINWKKINCPILIIGGKKDRLVLPNQISGLAGKLKADFFFFDSAHYLFWGDEGEKAIKKAHEWLMSQ